MAGLRPQGKRGLKKGIAPSVRIVSKVFRNGAPSLTVVQVVGFGIAGLLKRTLVRLRSVGESEN